MGWTHRLFGLCEHKWVEERRDIIARYNVVTPTREDRVGEAVYCRCEKCGVPRLFKLRV